MTIKQWLGIVSVCLGIMIASRYLPAPGGVGWFVSQALWSTLVALSVLYISTSTPAIIIAFIEFAAIIINFIACSQYLGAGSDFYAYYDYCVEANLFINITEGFILTIGAPMDGLVNRVKSMGLDNLFFNTNHRRSLEDSFSNQVESRWGQK